MKCFIHSLNIWTSSRLFKKSRYIKMKIQEDLVPSVVWLVDKTAPDWSSLHYGAVKWLIQGFFLVSHLMLLWNWGATICYMWSGGAFIVFFFFLNHLLVEKCVYIKIEWFLTTLLLLNIDCYSKAKKGRMILWYECTWKK